MTYAMSQSNLVIRMGSRSGPRPRHEQEAGSRRRDFIFHLCWKIRFGPHASKEEESKTSGFLVFLVFLAFTWRNLLSPSNSGNSTSFSQCYQGCRYANSVRNGVTRSILRSACNVVVGARTRGQNSERILMLPRGRSNIGATFEIDHWLSLFSSYTLYE